MAYYLGVEVYGTLNGLMIGMSIGNLLIVLILFYYGFMVADWEKIANEVVHKMSKKEDLNENLIKIKNADKTNDVTPNDP